MIEQTDDIAACRAIRRQVFVLEQHVPEAEEWDDLDDQAIHLIARDAAGQPVGTARLLVIAGGTGKITRVAVMQAARGTGIGASLIRASVAQLRQNPTVQRIKLGAQTHAIGFYERLGFVAFGPEYLDGGIPHRDMLQEL